MRVERGLRRRNLWYKIKIKNRIKMHEMLKKVMCFLPDSSLTTRPWVKPWLSSEKFVPAHSKRILRNRNNEYWKHIRFGKRHVCEEHNCFLIPFFFFLFSFGLLKVCSGNGVGVFIPIHSSCFLTFSLHLYLPFHPSDINSYDYTCTSTLLMNHQ